MGGGLMPVVSSGRMMATSTQTSWSSVDGFDHADGGLHPLGRYLGRHAGYDALYERQPLAAAAVNKLVGLQVQLPHKVYRRGTAGRVDAGSTPYGRVVKQPSMSVNPHAFWTWFASMRHIHGASFAMKQRGFDGVPVGLELIHPTRMRYGPEGGGWVTPSGFGLDDTLGHRWWFTPGGPGTERAVNRRDFLFWPSFNPTSPQVGLSPLEPLRDTLETEAAARAATLGQFRHGNRHTVVLKAPKSFGGNPAAVQRLRDQYQDIHGGVYNWSKPLVLEDGMDVASISMSNKDLEYVELRRLQVEEVCRVFDIPPPALQDLSRATFSNIVEQNRSLYRQTMPPVLTSFEAMLDFDLRDGSFGDGPPDFRDSYYCELLVDGVMRGSFEERISAHATAIQTFQMTPAEARELENRPFIDGSDVLLGNAAIEPITQVVNDVRTDPRALAELIQKIYLGTPDKMVISADEAREILNRAGAGLAGPAPDPPAGTVGALEAADRSTVMGRLSRPKAVDEIDVARLVDGLPPLVGEAVAGLVAVARLGGCSVAELRQMVSRIGVS